MAKANVLIVDDDTLILEGLRDVFEESDYNVQTSINGEGALKIAEISKLDIVFVDLMMPGMNGIDVCREIKKISSETEIILVTGHPEAVEKYRSDFINAGGRDEIIMKPMDGEELIAATEKVLKEKKS